MNEPSNAISPAPTLALSGGLSVVFVDFDQLLALLADMDEPRDRPETVARWAALLEKFGFEDRQIDPGDHPVTQREATLAADGTWRFAECMGIIVLGSLTDTGREVAEFAGLDLAVHRKALVTLLAESVESALVG